MHPFDEAIRLDPVGGELMRGRTHPGGAIWSAHSAASPPPS